MESGKAPCCCSYCKAAAQAFFISRKEVKNIHKEHFTQLERLFNISPLLSISAVGFVFFLSLLGGTSFGFQSFIGEMKILFQVLFYSILLSPDLMSEMWVLKKVTSQDDMGYLCFFQELQNQNQIKVDLKTCRKTK